MRLRRQAGVHPAVCCPPVLRILTSQGFLFRNKSRAGIRLRWQGFSPNHRPLLRLFVILLTSKSKLFASGWPLSPGQITVTALRGTDGSSPLPRKAPNLGPRPSLQGESEGARDGDGCGLTSVGYRHHLSYHS